MESGNFREILKRKMGGSLSENEVFKNPQNTFQQGVSEIFEPLFFIHIHAPKVPSSGAYPRPQHDSQPSSNKPLDAPPSVEENFIGMRVKKQDLDSIGQAKWTRFEKMVGQKFGDSLCETQVLRHFRKHLKSHHPDLNHGKSGDFALMVRIKNELIQVLKEQSNLNCS